MGILLIEKHNQRMVYLEDGSIVCEYKSKDSVGQDCWKLLRQLPPVVYRNDQQIPNVLIDFFLELFRDKVPASQRGPVSMEYRRLEINP